MIIVFWITCIILIFLVLHLLMSSLSQHPAWKSSLKTLINGFKEGLKGSGLYTHPKCPVELWTWQTMDDEHVCEDCLDRSQWPAMDIADWMKEGLPRTPEAETHCGQNCRCQLIPFKKNISSRKHHS